MLAGVDRRTALLSRVGQSGHRAQLGQRCRVAPAVTGRNEKFPNDAV